MLPKSHRLARKDFLQTKKLGKNIRLPWTSLLIFSNKLEINRWAVVTSTKLDKKAVVRNRLRRVIYNSVKILSGNHDVIIFPNKQAFKLSQPEICQTLKQVINI
ncbi:MAG: hypothetical protein UU93_C0001G0011 [Candidatus Amesbacteria bacterium GW2011_GWA2_42_12]|uniref:Uncharacterized protein n=1 Tax=Candidatus Amesbacteria bacterium GW2011_GWA2_42_12 TaxID=1618356 RepID=A0A0G0Y8Z1_9BACT|nr:MAG: hypothetical protein UU93_C0001G0011 [Candidatus Amesbacteria bacterium GW2011_GWA2_42_12]